MPQDLNLSEAEIAELNKNTPPEEKSADPVVPEGNDSKEISSEEILGALQNLGSQLEELKKPAETPTTPGDTKWVPKSWEDVDTRTMEAAEKALQERERKFQEAQSESQKEQQQLEVEIGKRVDELEKSGRLPKMTDSKNDSDPGVVARRELFAYASRYNTMDFKTVMDDLDAAHKANQYFDYKTFKWTDKSPNPGKDAPIGSSNHTTPAPTGSPDYKLIHGRSLDQLANIGMQDK